MSEGGSSSDRRTPPVQATAPPRATKGPWWRKPWVMVCLVLLALFVSLVLLAGLAAGWVLLAGVTLGAEAGGLHWLVLLSIPMAGAAYCAWTGTRHERGTDIHDRWIAAAAVLVIFAVATAAWTVIHL